MFQKQIISQLDKLYLACYYRIDGLSFITLTTTLACSGFLGCFALFGFFDLAATLARNMLSLVTL